MAKKNNATVVKEEKEQKKEEVAQKNVPEKAVVNVDLSSSDHSFVEVGDGYQMCKVCGLFVKNHTLILDHYDRHDFDSSDYMVCDSMKPLIGFHKEVRRVVEDIVKVCQGTEMFCDMFDRNDSSEYLTNLNNLYQSISHAHISNLLPPGQIHFKLKYKQIVPVVGVTTYTRRLASIGVAINNVGIVDSEQPRGLQVVAISYSFNNKLYTYEIPVINYLSFQTREWKDNRFKLAIRCAIAESSRLYFSELSTLPPIPEEINHTNAYNSKSDNRHDDEASQSFYDNANQPVLPQQQEDSSHDDLPQVDTKNEAYHIPEGMPPYVVSEVEGYYSPMQHQELATLIPYYSDSSAARIKETIVRGLMTENIASQIIARGGVIAETANHILDAVSAKGYDDNIGFRVWGLIRNLPDDDFNKVIANVNGAVDYYLPYILKQK